MDNSSPMIYISGEFSQNFFPEAMQNTDRFHNWVHIEVKHISSPHHHLRNLPSHRSGTPFSSSFFPTLGGSGTSWSPSCGTLSMQWHLSIAYSPILLCIFAPSPSSFRLESGSCYTTTETKRGSEWREVQSPYQFLLLHCKDIGDHSLRSPCVPLRVQWTPVSSAARILQKRWHWVCVWNLTSEITPHSKSESVPSFFPWTSIASTIVFGIVGFLLILAAIGAPTDLMGCIASFLTYRVPSCLYDLCQFIIIKVVMSITRLETLKVRAKWASSHYSSTTSNKRASPNAWLCWSRRIWLLIFCR